MADFYTYLGCTRSWAYTAEAQAALRELPVRGWLDAWRGAMIDVTAAARVQEHYAESLRQAQRARERADALALLRRRPD